jgi:hypothetical protein
VRCDGVRGSYLIEVYSMKVSGMNIKKTILRDCKEMLGGSLIGDGGTGW